jgi:hypothetical protein
MTNDKFRQLLPISGIISGLLLIAAIFIGPNVPQVSATNHAEVVGVYTDNTTTLLIAAIPLGLLSVFFLVPFLTELRATLRSGEAGEAIYSTLVTIGGSIVAMSVLGMSMVEAAVATAADSKLSADSILSIAVLNDYSWMPWVAGMAVLLLSVGIGGLRTATLPKPLSWVSIVLGALCLTGFGGIAVYFISPLWMIATAIVLIRRRSAAAAPVTATPAIA